MGRKAGLSCSAKRTHIQFLYLYIIFICVHLCSQFVWLSAAREAFTSFGHFEMCAGGGIKPLPAVGKSRKMGSGHRKESEPPGAD